MSTKAGRNTPPFARVRSLLRPVKRRALTLLGKQPPQPPPAPAKPAAPAGPEPWPGQVDDVDRKAITGTVEVPSDDSPLRVALLVNEVEIDHVDVPAGEGGAPGHFRFPVKDMWLYCGPKENVSVRVGDRPVRMPNGRLHHSPSTARTYPVSELKKRLDAGEIVSSNGALTLPKYLDEEWQRTATDVYRQVHDAVQELTGYEPWLIYGSLLGAVREGRPLGHDLDLDCAYLSKETDPQAVLDEVGRLAVALQERGFGVEAMTTCMHITDPDRRQRIDLYHVFFNDEGQLRLAWGSVSEQPFMRSQWQGIEHVTFGGADVLIPRNAEELVAVLYGPNWQTPNPGFDWKAERSARAEEAFFPAELRPIINWQNTWSNVSYDSPTSFARMVLRMDTHYDRIVDLACGDGRDAPLFVRSGSRVLGLDYTPAAIESARARQLDPAYAQFLLCDLAEAGALTSAVGGREQNRTLFYGRHLLDSIADDVEPVLLGAVASLMEPGDALALEFRGLKDETLWDHERRNCGRRWVDVVPVREALTAAGLELEIDAASGKWEKRGQTPMQLHRIVAVKPG